MACEEVVTVLVVVFYLIDNQVVKLQQKIFGSLYISPEKELKYCQLIISFNEFEVVNFSGCFCAP